MLEIYTLIKGIVKYKHKMRCLVYTLLAILALSTLPFTGIAAADGGNEVHHFAVKPFDTSPMFTQCPAIGNDTGCGTLITLNADGTVTVASDKNQGPYDGVEDTLIGIQNNTPYIIPSINLTSSLAFFGFDGDGICSGSFQGTPAGCPFGPTGYEGPNTGYAPTTLSSGIVTFTSGLAPDTSTYFSLEEDVNSATFQVQDSTPPICSAASGTNSTGQSYLQITVQDPGSGLATPPSGIVITPTNALVITPAYTAEFTGTVVFTATQIDPSVASAVSILATDAAGNVTNPPCHYVIPARSPNGPPTPPCVPPSCVTLSGGLDSYFSPLVLSPGTTAFSETALQGEQDITVSGFLTLSATDWRGNNEGFILTVAANGATSNATPTLIPGDDFYATHITATTVGCYGLNLEYCSGIQPQMLAPDGEMLGPSSLNHTVASVCRADNYVGNGVYTANVGMELRMKVGTPEGEVFTLYPQSWTYNFTVGAIEGDSVSALVSQSACTAPPVQVTP